MAELWKLEERVTFALRELYQHYGYAPFKMSKFEAYDLYMQNKEFLVSDGVITFTDTDGTLMALKPDVTLSIVKNFRKDKTPIQKVCYNENVYRISGASRQYREIMQSGLECMGDVGLYEICEVVALALRSLQSISEQVVLELSHMDILAGLLSEMELTEQQTTEVIQYLAEKNEDALLSVLTPVQADRLLPLMQISGPILPALEKLEGLAAQSAINELKTLATFLAHSGLPQEKVHLDFSIVSDRNYYNGIVFRGYVEGIPTNVLSGGQYDQLMDKMGKQAKAVGFAVYLDQLELLDRRSRAYDVDTVVVYGPDNDPVEILRVTAPLEREQTLILKEVPTRIRYRRLMKIEDGRLTELENHG